MSNNYLEVTNLKKSFGGLQAVNVQSIKLKKKRVNFNYWAKWCWKDNLF